MSAICPLGNFVSWEIRFGERLRGSYPNVTIYLLNANFAKASEIALVNTITIRAHEGDGLESLFTCFSSEAVGIAYRPPRCL